MMWDPLRFLESCPSSDGACAVVLTDEAGGKTAAADGRRRRGSSAPRCAREPSVSSRAATRSRPQARRRLRARRVRARPASPTRASRSTCAELYVPFSWYEPMWLEGHDIAGPGEGWKMVERGDTALDGSFPVNMSGGVLSSNPIGASGPAALRRGRAAGARAWPASTRSTGAKVALAQAYGASAQYFCMWVVAELARPVRQLTDRAPVGPDACPRSTAGSASPTRRRRPGRRRR